MALTKYRIGDLIQQRREKYAGAEGALPIRGVSREGFMPPKQEDADTSIYNVFYKGDFVFNPARMELNSIAYNSFYEKAICSSLYEIFYVTRKDVILPENKGLGIALSYGILECSNEIVARMDTDDIAREDRFEIQLKEFEENPNLDCEKLNDKVIIPTADYVIEEDDNLMVIAPNKELEADGYLGKIL